MTKTLHSNIRISDRVVKILEVQILEGSLKPGEALPSERDLAAEIGVSRPTIREAIRTLVSRGMLATRHGGRTVVTDKLDAIFIDSWQEMLLNHPNIQNDLLEFRHILEGQAAFFAAQRSTEIDLINLEKAHQILEFAYAGQDLKQSIDADVAFHQAIAEASHNVLIGHLSSSLFKLINGHVTKNLEFLHTRPLQWKMLEQQHYAIWQAIRDHQPEAALKAANGHIEFVVENMKTNATVNERLQSAMRRQS